jgi:sulfur-carrier protein adenylyltransferase/sulfurtransferase
MTDIWFIRDLSRLDREREEISNLEMQAQWLQGTSWTLDGGKLSIEAIIHTHGYDYAIKMIYPAHFPEVPPEVYPQNTQESWSTHQYLNGALCLEWRPDTWHSEVTGAQVLESVYTLLDTENPRGTGDVHVVPVQHEFSIGRILRGSYFRSHIAQDIYIYLENLPLLSIGHIDYWIHWQSHSSMIFIRGFQPNNMLPPWHDSSIPKPNNNTERKGFFLKTSNTSEEINQIDNLQNIRGIIEQNECIEFSCNESSNWSEYSIQSLLYIILVDIDNQVHGFLKISADSEDLHKVTMIHSERPVDNPRAPEEFHELLNKSIGIVGLGSVGSKMAISLARSGVKKIYLIDEDIFLVSNIFRNSLDWRNVGEYKVHAVREVISYISSDIDVDVETLNLGGQQTSSNLDRVLKRLSRCDLIIDATANSRVFNLLAFTSKISLKPLLWGEVFAGGIGGMIARSRPEQEPEAQVMRAVFHKFLSEQEAPLPQTSIEPYQLKSQTTDILEASDADVSVIAAYLTQLAIDTLLQKEQSSFPFSMYLIGLKKEWIFKAPFHVFPIDAGSIIQEESDIISNETVHKGLDFLRKLLEEDKNANSSS